MAGRRPCCRRRLIFGLIFLCSFVFLYCFTVSETSSDWTEQWWSHYVNRTSHLATFSQNSPLKHLYLHFSQQRTTTNMTTNMAIVTTTTVTTQPPVEYKSPGPYLVEYPYKYTFLINEPKKCQQTKPFLVLMVPVAPHNKNDRQIIRETWGAGITDKKVALFFVLGLANPNQEELMEESRQYGDLIQSNFVDCYKNLTIKSMVMLEWLDTYCHQATYAMKVDSDIFLNLPKLMEMLQHAPKTNYLTGLVERAAMVHRYSSSKWFVPFEIYSGSVYPPYALGLGYIFSLDLAKKLVEASRSVKALYIEDVYLGMCLQHIGLHPHDPTIHGAFSVFPLQYNRCHFSRIIATTLHQHTDRRQLWQDFSRPQPYCQNT